MVHSRRILHRDLTLKSLTVPTNGKQRHATSSKSITPPKKTPPKTPTWRRRRRRRGRKESEQDVPERSTFVLIALVSLLALRIKKKKEKEKKPSREKGFCALPQIRNWAPKQVCSSHPHISLHDAYRRECSMQCELLVH